MTETAFKRYIFASDFDQTLSFNDSGYVLSEMLGIPAAEFERKALGMARLNLVQQGAELAYLLLHDPEFHSRVRKEHLYEVGKKIRLKNDIALLYEILESGIPGYHFDFYVDRKSTRLNSSHSQISYAVFCLKKKTDVYT